MIKILLGLKPRKAYKATYNMKCLGKIYEVGETYICESPIKLCMCGLHFCKKPDDVLEYYDYKEDCRKQLCLML